MDWATIPDLAVERWRELGVAGAVCAVLLAWWLKRRLSRRALEKGLRLGLGTPVTVPTGAFQEVVNARFEVAGSYREPIHAFARFALRQQATGKVLGPFKGNWGANPLPADVSEMIEDSVVEREPGEGSDVPIAARVKSRANPVVFVLGHPGGMAGFPSSIELTPGEYLVHLRVRGNFKGQVEAHYQLKVAEGAPMSLTGPLQRGWLKGNRSLLG